jgi:hypothetical protein
MKKMYNKLSLEDEKKAIKMGVDIFESIMKDEKNHQNRNVYLHAYIASISILLSSFYEIKEMTTIIKYITDRLTEIEDKMIESLQDFESKEKEKNE